MLEKKDWKYYLKRLVKKPDINEIELTDWMGNRFAFRSQPGYTGPIYGIDLTRRTLDPYSVSSADGRRALYYCYFDVDLSKIKQDYNIERKMGFPRISTIGEDGELWPIFCIKDDTGFKWASARYVMDNIKTPPKL
jgi:hypothetical protein